MDTVSWSTQQLAQFLEVFATTDRDRMLRTAVDRVAESLDAEVVALVIGSEVVESRGFPAGHEPTETLVSLASCDAGRADLPGMPAMELERTTVGQGGGTVLLVGRLSAHLDREEWMLLRSMGQAMGLALARSDLLAQLGEKYELSARLLEMQRSISHRAPLQEVLDAVTRGAAELLDADVVGLNVSLGGNETVASVFGADERQRRQFAATSVDAGFAGRALAEDRLVVTDDYRSEPGIADPEGEFLTRAAMATPVHRSGVPVGVLSVASRDPERRFSSAEREILRMFAKHVSLAVNDASVVRAIRQSLESAEHLARHDPLTGLLNRSAVIENLDLYLAEATLSRPVAVLFVDVDRFKMINDLHGHAVGDAVLVEVGRRLSSAVRSSDLVARQAGDEFLVVANAVLDDELDRLATRIVSALEAPIETAGRDIHCSVSVGVAVATAPESGDSMLLNADVAMYRAKQRGRSSVVRFDQDMRIQMIERSDTERELRAAIRDQRGLVADYQPIYSAGSGHIVGFEALARWQHPQRGLIAAADFVPVAEETGLIRDVDHQVLLEATRQLLKWRALSPSLADLTMSVNVSSGLFGDPELVYMVGNALDSTGLPPECLWLEITETTMMEETQSTMDTLATLSEFGVGLSIDDFGTGYSSLAYLKHFPVSNLKVDRTFVSGVCRNQDDETIVTAVIRLADALGLRTIAEGVESAEQLRWLEKQGCDLVQGYLLSRPVPAATAEQLLFGPAGPACHSSDLVCTVSDTARIPTAFTQRPG